MLGVKITDLPLITVLRDTDQLLVAREDSSRRVPGSAFIRPADIANFTTALQTLSTNTIFTTNTPTILLNYDNNSRLLAAEINLVSQNKGGTGFTNYSDNQVLVGTAAGTLSRFGLSATNGISFTKTSNQLVISNDTPFRDTNLTNTASTSTVTISSSTGTSTVIQNAAVSAAGVMSAEDKRDLLTLVKHLSAEVSSNFVVTTQLNNYTLLVNSANQVLIELPTNVEFGTKIGFIKIGNGDISFVPGLSSTITAAPNSTFTKLTQKYVYAYAEYRNPSIGWHLYGELSSQYPRTLQGPQQIDTVQKVSFTTISLADILYYEKNWDKTTNTYTSMTITLNSNPRAVVDFTTDRIGKPFRYRLESSIGEDSLAKDGPDYYGIFSTGNVALSSL